MKTHGMSRERMYVIFSHIKDRCNNNRNDSYKNYGGRGIKCLWKSFEEYRNDMIESYLKHLNIYGEMNTTLDRIDNASNYCKKNCRWATRKEQSRNSRKYKGLKQIAEDIGINYNSFHARVRRGWTIEEIKNISTVKQKKKRPILKASLMT